MDDAREQPSPVADERPPSAPVHPAPPNSVSDAVNDDVYDFASEAIRQARKVVVLVVGVSVVLFGIALIVLPGPAFVVIPAGLAILGTEFVWARRLLRRVRDRAQKEFRALWGGGDSDARSDADNEHGSGGSQ